MTKAYQINDPDGIYFVTFATVEWVDVFTRQIYRDILVESLSYCRENKGLKIHAWCLMSNHLHLIISRNGDQSLSEILRDFKKFTSSQILKAINKEAESRKNWMIWLFRSAGKKNSRNSENQFWQQNNHAEWIESNNFINQKLNYIHNNPVQAGLVYEPEHYIYSSARDYSNMPGLLKIDFLD